MSDFGWALQGDSVSWAGLLAMGRDGAVDMVLAKWNRAPDTYLVTIIGASDKFLLKVKGQSGVGFHVRRM
jgi:hypothetical protein